MRLLTQVSLLLLAGHPLFSQQAAGVVSGTVRYGDTGKPADGISLWLTSAEATAISLPDPKTGEYIVKDREPNAEKSLLTRVEADGSFALRNVPPGTYLVHTFSSGYVSPDNTVFPTSNTAHVSTGSSPSRDALQVKVVADEPTEPIHIVLQRGGAIEGFVRSAPEANGADKPPPPGWAVNAERKLGVNSYARAGVPAHTDEKGYFHLDGLAPGSYIIFTEQLGSGAMVRTANGSSRGSGELPIYAPNTVRPSQAAVITIRQAETQHLDIVLPAKTTLHRIEGNVEIEGLEPLQNALVRLFPADEGGLTAASPLSAQRSFSFLNVPDGDYTIEVAFPPTPTVVSIDAANGIIHMRMVPLEYASASEHVHIAGHDVTNILLTPPHR